MKSRLNKPIRTAHIVDDSFEPVVPNLAVTPAQMSQMAARGIPIAAQSLDSFVDGVSNPSYDLPIESQRGIDVVQVWDAQKSARKKIISAHQTDKVLYD